MGFWSTLLGGKTDEEKEMEANQFVQDFMSDADARRQELYADLGDQVTVEEMEQINEEIEYTWWGARKN